MNRNQKRKFHCADSGRVWSIDRDKLLQWLEWQISYWNAQSKDSDCLIYTMTGWRELQQKPIAFHCYFRPGGLTVGAAKEVIKKVAAGDFQIQFLT